MSMINSLTPKNTEEIRPGLFIQKTNKGYRQIYPSAWNGKMNWNNFLWGSGFFKSFIWFAILLLIVYGYNDSTTRCSEFQENPCKYLSNITSYCLDLDQSNSINPFEFKDGEQRDSNSIQGNPWKVLEKFRLWKTHYEKS